MSVESLIRRALEETLRGEYRDVIAGLGTVAPTLDIAEQGLHHFEERLTSQFRDILQQSRRTEDFTFAGFFGD